MTTQKLWAQKWPGSVREARRSVFLREPPPVSEDFFPWFQQTFPSVATSPDPALVTRLLYSGLKVASEGREIPLAYSLLEPFLKADWRQESGRSVRPIAEAVAEALGVSFRAHSRDLHLARCIQFFPREKATQLLTLWHGFRLPPSDSEALHPITKEKTRGTKYKSTVQQAKRVVQGAEVEAEADPSLRRILEHLHHPLPPILVTRTEEQIFAVEAERNEALPRAADNEERNETRQRYALRLQRLHGALANACGGFIWHRPSENYRIYTHGETLVTIHGEDRRAITRQSDGFFEFDLASAHLAIGNYLFGGPELTKLLRQAQEEKQSLWGILLDWIGYVPEDKTALKECVYAMTYGSSELRQCSLLVRDEANREAITRNLDLARRKLRERREPDRARRFSQRVKGAVGTFLDEEEVWAVYERLIQHPAIRELLEHRERYESQILANGGAADAFGLFQPVADNPSTTISTLASSYEKWLLWPIYEKAFSRREFEVILDQHDGLTIRFTRKDDGVRWRNQIQRLQQAVQERADRLGIWTHLEIKNT